MLPLMDDCRSALRVQESPGQAGGAAALALKAAAACAAQTVAAASSQSVLEEPTAAPARILPGWRAWTESRQLCGRQGLGFRV